MDTLALPNLRDVPLRLNRILTSLAQLADERNEMIANLYVPAAQQEHETPRRILADVLRERAQAVLATNLSKLAVMGRYNAGKSTFINALLGCQVLSTDWKPTTAVPVVLKYGHTDSYSIKQHQDTDLTSLTVHQTDNLLRDLAPLTTISAAPAAQTIEEVVVWCDAAFLNDYSVELIDTPGLGSAFEAQTAITYSVLPRVDAVLYLFAENPGVAETDIAFLRLMREHVQQVLLVMSKVDYHEPPEQVQNRAEYSGQIINKKAGFPVDQVYPVSVRTAPDGTLELNGEAAFLVGLQQLLVRASGSARYQPYLNAAQAYWLYLKNAVLGQIQMADYALNDVQEDLTRLEAKIVNVETRKKELLDYVKQVIDEGIAASTTNVNELHSILQNEVEKSLEQYTPFQLMNVDKLIIATAKNTIEKWLAEEVSKFEAKADELQKRIVRDLQNMFQIIQDSAHAIQLDSIDDLGIDLEEGFSTVTSKFVQISVKKGYSFFIANLVVSELLTVVVGLVLGPFGILIRPILNVAQELQGRPVSLDGRLRLHLQSALSAPIPNNSIDVYTALIEGYKDESGVMVDGVRQMLQHAFTRLGDELHQQIERAISTSLDFYLNQLRQRIETENNGQWSKSQRVAIYRRQYQSLLSLERDLDAVRELIQHSADKADRKD